MDNEIYIIQNNFDRSFFFEQPSEKTIHYIQHSISLFQQQFPDCEQNVYTALRQLFTNAVIENHTQFFNNDRCVRFLIQISLQERYVMQVSVFGFFCVYKHAVTFNEGRYYYDDVIFINPLVLKQADDIYSCLPKNSLFKWLSQTQFTEVIPEFSAMDDDVRFQYLVTVADVLFTKHYI